jgi:hypothetical protein
MQIKQIDNNYSISEFGNVYKNGKELKPYFRPDKNVYRVFINGKNKNLASLVAENFIIKPTGKNHLIFKDKNSKNVHYSNLAYVDGATFYFYSKGYSGSKKIILEQNEAILKAKNEMCKKYYETLNEMLIFEIWENIKQKLSKKYDFIIELIFNYFYDRIKRFSIIKDPLGLCIAFAENQLKLRYKICIIKNI